MRDPRLEKLLDPSYGQATRIQFLEILRGLVDHGIQAGIFRKDLDRDMAAVTIMGTCTSAIDFLGMGYSPEELTQRLSHFLLTMFIAKTDK